MQGPFKIVALWCWYRGEGFHGYQRQGALRTVQGELLGAFSRAGVTRNPVVAGRTDKGVSARMQVLSGRLERDIEPQALAAALNAQLPDDVGIHLARDAATGFHAAWSSSWKEYRYLLSEPVDAGLLREAAALIPGTRNFRVFHFKSSEEKPRTVRSVEVMSDGVTLRFVGEGFARHMVRMLVGGMTAVATGAIPLEVFADGLAAQRKFHCPTAPPEPLTLWEVGYPPGVDPFSPEDRAAPKPPSLS